MTNVAPSPMRSGRNMARQHRFWNRRAAAWDEGAGENQGLLKVVEEVVREADCRSDEHVVDLGCGSGQVTLAIARHAASVTAVDISEKMIELLVANAEAAGIHNLHGRASAIERLGFPPESVDVVVTNYVLHHLRDADKAVVVRRVHEWLRPGGRFVVGDMMFGRGGEQRDREIIASKLSVMARKGPAGWWRIAKNAGRFLFRVQERPVGVDAWTAMFIEAGFADVTATNVVNEAAVVKGTKAPAGGVGVDDRG